MVAHGAALIWKQVKMEGEFLEPERETDSELGSLIEKILDKGLVINADIIVSVAGAELLGIKIRAALASFETAAQYGLQFPSGTNVETAAWEKAMIEKESCPQCSKMVAINELLNKSCPWCGWESAKVKSGKVVAKLNPIKNEIR